MSEPRSFWSDLWAQPPAPHSLLSRYTVANGYLYLAIGVVMYLLPATMMARLFFVDDMSGYTPGLARAIGATVAVIGWFYLMGGRTRADSFGLSTVVDRLLIPLVLLPLWLLDQVALGMVLPFAILDPVLGIGAYVIWRRERASRGPEVAV